MKKILIPGTGSAQKDMIEFCKEKGLYVIATSNVSGYSAEKIADEFYQIDITDIEATERLAEYKGVDFIYTIGSDVAMSTIAKVSEDLGLPCFIDHDIAYICNHKHMLRKALSEIRQGREIPFQIIEDPDEDIAISFPLVMKPSDSQGQRGVRKVNDIKELKYYFSDTLKFSREKKVIVEQYIEGDEVSVNMFMENGQIRFYLVSDREAWKDYPGGLIHKHFIPSKYNKDEFMAGKIRSLVEESLDRIGLRNGPAYFQIMIDHDRVPYIIEITPRLDGCHIWRAIRYSTGVDLLEACLDLLEGRNYRQNEIYEVEPYTLEFFCGKPGTVFSKAEYTVPEHVYLNWYYKEGQTINNVNGYYEKCGYVIMKGMGT